jgi:hypothetical protein
MTLEQQENFQRIITKDFTGMKNMLDLMRERIMQYPVYTQLEFIKPLQGLINEAFIDACDPNNEFLNNYDGGDRIDIPSEPQAPTK